MKNYLLSAYYGTLTDDLISTTLLTEMGLYSSGYVCRRIGGRTVVIGQINSNSCNCWSSDIIPETIELWENSVISAYTEWRDIAFGNGIWIIAGHWRLTAKSSDSITWTVNQQLQNNDRSLYAVTFAFGKFIASGTLGSVFTSTDGNSWVESSQVSVDNVSGLCSDGKKIVAVGFTSSDSGKIFTATDSAGPWTLKHTLENSLFVSANYQNGLFLVPTSDGKILTSATGDSWNVNQTPTSSLIRRVEWDGVRFIAVCDSGEVLVSANGASWIIVNNENVQIVGVATMYDPPIFSPQPADGITFTPRTIETPFRTESRNLRRFFVQGAPVFEAELKFDVDHSEIEAMDSWLESVGLGTFSRSAFAIGNADTIFQVLEPPTRSFSHKGMTVSMSVTATQDTPAYLPYPINEGVLPVCCPFPLSGQGSLGSEAAQLTEATGGRSTAKAFTASRGDRLSFTYATDKDGLAHFISWWSAILKCGHRGFFASMPGRTCWYFEFTEQPTFSLQSDLGKVTIKIQGRPTTKEITVTGGSTTISKTGLMDLTTNFSGTQRVVLVDAKNRLVDYDLYSSGGFENALQLDLFGVPIGEYRWVIVSTMGMSKWFDIKVVA